MEIALQTPWQEPTTCKTRNVRASVWPKRYFLYYFFVVYVLRGPDRKDQKCIQIWKATNGSGIGEETMDRPHIMLRAPCVTDRSEAAQRRSVVS